MYKNYIKPLLDFIIALILIIILLPLIIVIGLITYFNLGWPIFNERRFREGKNKKPFIMYKFRTKILEHKRKDNQPIYTKTSRMIDKFRLNEILQLFNVLKGDMSLVGPRPFIPGEELPDGKISPKRYLLKPGITGLAQVSGGRYISHQEKLAYDVIYYDNISFWLDLKILVKTLTFQFRK